MAQRWRESFPEGGTETALVLQNAIISVGTQKWK